MDINDIFKNLFEGTSINISIKFVRSDDNNIDVINNNYELVYNDVIKNNGKVTFIIFCPNTQNLFFRINNGFLEIFYNEILILRKDIKKDKKYIGILSKLNNNTLTITLS